MKKFLTLLFVIGLSFMVLQQSHADVSYKTQVNTALNQFYLKLDKTSFSLEKKIQTLVDVVIRIEAIEFQKKNTLNSTMRQAIEILKTNIENKIVQYSKQMFIENNGTVGEMQINTYTDAVVRNAIQPTIDGYKLRSRDIQRQSALRVIKLAISAYFVDNNKYPSKEDFALIGRTYMTKIPLDPMNGSQGKSCRFGYTYTVNTEGSEYLLSACMENTQSATRDNGKSSVEYEIFEGYDIQKFVPAESFFISEVL